MRTRHHVHHALQVLDYRAPLLIYFDLLHAHHALQVCPPGPFGKNTPQFHVKDASCGENDPNGPSYDPVHGVYHLHYQNHVGLHGGRTYGHAVSKDMTKWAHMPDSIWNDHSYDASAIYTGSATIVNGTVIQVWSPRPHHLTPPHTTHVSQGYTTLTSTGAFHLLRARLHSCL